MSNDLTPNELKAVAFIQSNILYDGKSPSLRAIGDVLGFKSPRSAYVLVTRLVDKGYLEKTKHRTLRVLKDIHSHADNERTISLPLVGTAPCGVPLLAEQNIEAMIPVSQKLVKPGATYFLLRASGDSMDKAGIKDGDIMLVRQQPVAENGDRVVALIDDSATIKEFKKEQGKIMLIPRSSNPEYKPTFLDGDFMVQGVVVNTLPNPA